MNIRQMLDDRITVALHTAGAPETVTAIVKPSARPEFGDYQANGVMAAAKQLKMKPRELANQVLEHLDLSDVAAQIEVAGPGFLNIHLRNAWLAEQLTRPDATATAEPRQTIVVDYSSPNLAKEMHVGHLRSTIIGDAMVRVLTHLGHTVIRQNHVGDWGTQFGMLLAHMADLKAQNQSISTELADLEQFYRQAKQRFDAEPDFAERARKLVVKLQSGDAECLQLWQQFIDISLTHCETTYERLGVSLSRADVKAESSYNADLPSIISELQAQDLLREDQGAQCAFMEEFKNRNGDIMGLIVQKSGGGYLYSTTDLAALRYRQHTLQAERILYFVDARQAFHFQQVYALARKAGFVYPDTSLEHMAFGTMLGEDGTPFKTRSGDTVKLADLLDEAEERAYQLVSTINPEMPDAERREVAHKVGIGAVKYADLSKNRNSDYIFNLDAMVSFEGNTAPYLQYAYTRIRSIFRKLGREVQADATLNLLEPAERTLALKLLQLDEVLHNVAQDGLPNQLATYLHELAGNLMTFYEACPILKVGITDEVRESRLLLIDKTADTLKTGLGLLGIEVMERM